MVKRDYCGCCGRPMERSYNLFCNDCNDHIDKDAEFFWERTYFAQHGRNCPFQEDLPDG